MSRVSQHVCPCFPCWLCLGTRWHFSPEVWTRCACWSLWTLSPALCLLDLDWFSCVIPREQNVGSVGKWPMEEDQKCMAEWHLYFRLRQRWRESGRCEKELLRCRSGWDCLQSWAQNLAVLSRHRPPISSAVLQGLVCPLHALLFTWELMCPPLLHIIVVGHFSSLA